MNECEFQFRLSSYHDGELDLDAALSVEQHLGQCPVCRAELAGLREMSAGIAIAGSLPGRGEIDRLERLRLHQAIDQTVDEQDDSLPMFRTMGLLGAMAASVLIVSGVWLLELRTNGVKPHRPTGDNLAMLPDWQRVALTLRADPRPEMVEDSFYAPKYAGAVNMMLDGLQLSER